MNEAHTGSKTRERQRGTVENNIQASLHWTVHGQWTSPVPVPSRGREKRILQFYVLLPFVPHISLKK